MGQVLVRNLDDDLISALKIRAKLRGVSLENFLRDILKSAGPLTGEERVAVLSAFHGKHGRITVGTSPEKSVRRARDER